MTATTGMGRPPGGVRRSVPWSSTASPDAPLSVDNGGTGKATALEARAALGVPGLADDNTFTGINTFASAVVVSSASGIVINTGPLEVGGTSTLGRTEWGGTVLQPPTFVLSNLSLALSYVAKTADYTLTNQDIVVNVTANSPTLTLPTAVGCAGRLYVIKNSGAGTVTLATTSSQTIDGGAPGTVAAGVSISVVSTGANWIIV